MADLRQSVKDEIESILAAAGFEPRPRRFYPRMQVCQKCLKLTDDLEYHQDYFCYYFRLESN